MRSALNEIERTDLINLGRLAHILKGLNEVELETLGILLDEEASMTISQSLNELEAGKRIRIDEW